ncbi:MAG: single-stranded DNA-binding protein [Hungatella hathewayi]|nr:single-stranded DNA-binding protein [Hungatella hathewayi]
MIDYNNRAVLIGKVDEETTYSHTIANTSFYTTGIIIHRLSGVGDNVPLLVNEKYIEILEKSRHQIICIQGEMRSHMVPVTKKLLLFVLVKEVITNISETTKQSNNILLDGFICKNALFRVTPLGRKITDFILAVNHSNGRSSYIPCICWGKNARNIIDLPVGAKIEVVGRIQSREYTKIIDDNISEKRTAIEVSIRQIKEVS